MGIRYLRTFKNLFFLYGRTYMGIWLHRNIGLEENTWTIPFHHVLKRTSVPIFLAAVKYSIKIHGKHYRWKLERQGHWHCLVTSVCRKLITVNMLLRGEPFPVPQSNKNKWHGPCHSDFGKKFSNLAIGFIQNRRARPTLEAPEKLLPTEVPGHTSQTASSSCSQYPLHCRKTKTKQNQKRNTSQTSNAFMRGKKIFLPPTGKWQKHGTTRYLPQIDQVSFVYLQMKAKFWILHMTRSDHYTKNIPILCQKLVELHV